MPATVHEMNQAQVAAAMVFTFAALSSNMEVGLKGFDASVSSLEAIDVPLLTTLLAGRRCCRRSCCTEAPCRRPSQASSLPTSAAPRCGTGSASALSLRPWGTHRGCCPLCIKPPAPRPSPPPCPQVKERNPNDLNSDVEVGLWLRYTASDALDEALRAGSGEGGHGMPPVAPPAGHPDVPAGAAAVGMGCPVGGGAAMAAGSDAAAGGGGGGNPSAMPAGISPQLYASMDADERTAVVFRHLPPALLHFVEAALQVGG